jgi:DNA (cytosine-5)-methyltransferase 1
MKKITFIDLFSGCGGLSEGFLKSGKFEGLAHVEWELPMVNTLRNRLRNKWKYSNIEVSEKVIHFDIQKSLELINGNWSDESLKKYEKTNSKKIINKGLKGIVKRDVDLIIGGPPCQAYSIPGRAQDKNSMKDDYRNFLFESFIKVVNQFKPKMFVFENVTGMLSAKTGGVLVVEKIYQAFSDAGYEILPPERIKESILNSNDYGVPQSRKRVIIVGIKKVSKISDLNNIYSKLKSIPKNTKIKTVKDAIGDLKPFYPLKKQIKLDGKNISHDNYDLKDKIHFPRFHNKRDISIFKDWIIEGLNSRNLKEQLDFYSSKTGKNSGYNKYRNLVWNKPSPTIVAHLQKDGLLFIHPDPKQARTLTVREAARLQSFPDDYEFLGSQGFNYKMIGNAVPPLLGNKIAEVLFEELG